MEEKHMYTLASLKPSLPRWNLRMSTTQPKKKTIRHKNRSRGNIYHVLCWMVHTTAVLGLLTSTQKTRWRVYHIVTQITRTKLWDFPKIIVWASNSSGPSQWRNNLPSHRWTATPTWTPRRKNPTRWENQNFSIEETQTTRPMIVHKYMIKRGLS